MLRKLRSLSKFSPREVFILLQFFIFALIVHSSLRCVALPRVIAFGTGLAKNRFWRCLPLSQNYFQLTQLTLLASTASRFARPNGPCLLRSLLLFWLLKSRDEPAELLIGINKDTSVLQSHAWVESPGKILADSPEMAESFATLLRF
jgi:hypothetical protein